jgi:hypothetical protein
MIRTVSQHDINNKIPPVMAAWLSFQMFWLHLDAQHRVGVMTFVDNHCLHRKSVDILKTYAENEAILSSWEEKVGLGKSCSQASVVCCRYPRPPVNRRGFLGRPESGNSRTFPRRASSTLEISFHLGKIEHS